MKNYFSILLEKHQYINEKNKIENNITDKMEKIENLNKQISKTNEEIN